MNRAAAPAAATGGEGPGARPPARPVASLSLDLDNLWSYLRTHGEPGWQSFPSYLDVAVPRILETLDGLGLRLTFFVVGLDATRPENREPIARLAAAGHEIANHSFRHEPWLHLYSEADLDAELARAEEAIEAATGVRPTGFRGPGFSLSATALRVLGRRGYRYDCSTLPTYLGPLARAYYFRTARLEAEERRRRARLFGTFDDGLRPLAAYRLRLGDGMSLVELPVTTMPGIKTPIHPSYLFYLALTSPRLARAYFATALRLCRWNGIQPSILLHPLDFLGSDDTSALAFFPAMKRPAGWKLEQLRGYLEALRRDFEVVPTGRHVELLEQGPPLPEREPRFRHREGTAREGPAF